MVRFSYSKPSAVACTGFGGEPNEEKAELPGNEASLNFVSLRSLCNFVGRLGPSRVKIDRKSTRLNSSHGYISYAVFCLKKKKKNKTDTAIMNKCIYHTKTPNI